MVERIKMHIARGLGLVVLMTTLSLGWTIGDFTIDVTNAPMNIKVTFQGKTIADITSFSL